MLQATQQRTIRDGSSLGFNRHECSHFTSGRKIRRSAQRPRAEAHLVHYTPTHDAAAVLQAARTWAAAGGSSSPALVCGSSTCRAALTAQRVTHQDIGGRCDAKDTGFVSSDGAAGGDSAALAACAFADDDGAFGVGFRATDEGASRLTCGPPGGMRQRTLSRSLRCRQNRLARRKRPLAVLNA